MALARHSAPAAGRRATAGAAALALAALVAATIGGLGLVRAPEAAAAVTPHLPFDQAASTSSKLVLAHYVPWFPVSYDNKPAVSDTYAVSYLDPNGESGKHAAYGGFLRDRPLGRPVSASTDWRSADMRHEVRDAIAAGIDGFAVDVVSVNRAGRSWAAVTRLLDAAAAVDPGFRIVLQPDMVGLAASDSATIAAALADLGDHPSAYHLADGRLVVSPYLAERRTVAWWSEWMATMATAHGVKVALFPVLQNDQTWADDFAGISMGIGNWGSRNPQWNPPTATYATSPRGRIAAVHARGDLWMQPVSVQDQRPRDGLFDEAGNTENLRATWQIAREGGADWVLLPTWNDYAEGSAIAPSTKHGRALLDLVAYYAEWFKTGRAPQVVRDAVYVTHRTQLAGAGPEFPETRLMTLRGGTATRDTVEALAFLTAPATVTISVGGVTTSCSAPAGVASCLAPLRTGAVAVSVARSGAPVASVLSPYVVDATPYVQDLQYVAVSSLRSSAVAVPGATSTPAPTPAPSLSATPAPTRTAAPAPTTSAPRPTAPATSTAPATTAPAPSSGSAAPPAVVAATTLLTLSAAGGLGTPTPSFRATVWPAADGLVILWVDGAAAARAWTTPTTTTVALAPSALGPGRHAIWATFSPTSTAQYRFSQSSSLSVTTP